MRVHLSAAQEAGATTLDLGIIADAAGVKGLEQALDAAIARGADVLLTSGALTLRLHPQRFSQGSTLCPDIFMFCLGLIVLYYAM